MVADLMDPARMYNYWRTMETELLALAPKAPFIVAAGQLDGHPEWKDANQKPYSALVYEPAFVEQPDGSKQVLPPPQRCNLFLYQRVRSRLRKARNKTLWPSLACHMSRLRMYRAPQYREVALQASSALSDIGHFPVLR